MKVALVHDDLVQWGGAERILLGLCEIFPNAPIYTSVFDYSNNQLREQFAHKKIITSFLQKIPAWRSLYKILLPFYPIAFEQFIFDDFDLVISNTTRFAKVVLTKPKTIHICYCHTPPRFLWNFSSEIYLGLGFLFSKLRIYDRISTNRVDYFLAGSKNAQKRIKKAYGRDSRVLYPFIELEKYKDIEVFDGGYFLVIARLNKYKRVDLAIEACSKMGVPLKVIGKGNLDIAGDIEFLGELDDEMVMQVLAGCRGIIIPGIEDFGLTSLEAQALGKPVIAYGSGGSLETVIERKTGILFEHQSTESLIGALKKMDNIKLKAEDCKENAGKFSKNRFKKEFAKILAKLGYTI